MFEKEEKSHKMVVRHSGQIIEPVGRVNNFLAVS